MKLTIVDPERCVGCQLCMFACSRTRGEVGLASSSIGVRSAGGMENGFKIIVCRGCPEPPCASVCPTGALTKRQGGGVVFNPKKCIGCGHCKDACIVGAVFWDNEINKPQICRHCGYCVKYCPHGVLGMAEEDLS